MSIALAILKKKKVSFLFWKEISLQLSELPECSQTLLPASAPNIWGHGCSSSHLYSTKDLPWIPEAKKYNFNLLIENCKCSERTQLPTDDNASSLRSMYWLCFLLDLTPHFYESCMPKALL